MTAAIEARGLSRSFGDVHAVEGVSLSVGPGEMMALLGADGAGKTTTLRLLAGVLRPDSGSAWISGIDLAQEAEGGRARLGYLPQRFGLYDDLTVWENLRFIAEVRSLPAQTWAERTRQILEFVGLAEFADRRAQALSGGMRQKLALAASLLHRPSVLLLDEPTGGVDPVTRQAFWRLLVRLLAEGVAILITTPYMDEAERCSRVAFLHAGRLLLQGTPAELMAPLEGRIVEVSGESPSRLLAAAAGRPEVMEAWIFGAVVRLRLAQEIPGVQGRLADDLRSAGARAAHLRRVTPSLEDVFRELLVGGTR